MALIKCPDCGREVSSRAVSCPTCGCPIAELASSAPAPVAASTPAVAKQSPEERELILAHLNDLRALELLKWKYEKPVIEAAQRYGISEYSSPADFVMKLNDKIYKLKGYEKGGAEFDRVCSRLKPALSGEDYQKKIQVRVALKKAYEPNIIPAPFRNLHGVYYLYDYLSTSQESLSDALLHLDLDIIKSKLDTVIKQQGDQILLSIATNIQLASMQQKFDRLIETVQSISQDTAAIAKYSAISAAHLETIKILQFIK